MKKIKHFISIIFILAIGVLLVCFIFFYQSSETLTQTSQTLGQTSGTYTNKTYNFSLTLPDGFKSQEIESENSHAVTITNEKGEGIQIVVSPYDDVKTMTAEMIHKAIPNLKILEPQTVEVGDNYKGIAFKSDNSAFGGASREIWFVFKGNLYQISTYEKFDDLLKNIFGTWKFL